MPFGRRSVLMTLFGTTLFTGALLSQVPTEYRKEIYQQRRAKLAQLLGDALAIVLANPEPDIDEFVQNNYFYYLTGLEVPNAALVLWPGAPRETWKEILFLPPKDPQQEVWTGPKLAPDKEAAELTGIATVLPTTQFETMLGRLLSQHPTVAILNEPIGLNDPPTRYLQLVQKIRERYPALPVINLSVHLDDMRRVKDDYELGLLQKAIDITGEALLAAMRAVRPGMYEYELEALIEYEFKRRGAMQLAFPSIIGAGLHTTILHYNQNRGRVEDGDLVLMDVGARYAYYCADVTRTVPANGRFTKEQRAIYEIVLEAQNRALAAIRPGVKIRDVVHRAAAEFIREKGYGDYFPHSTSHYLGMDVHDVGDYNKPLEPGVVITVEPGIYIPEKKLGVRIEDDVLVTADGYRLLSGKVPRDPDEIERVMGKKQ
ncbi:Xaa-Pro aminopeptidase [bacterium HR11]|nr:Xaa-Pro aminopeptidase [bacterium HR11]